MDTRWYRSPSIRAGKWSNCGLTQGAERTALSWPYRHLNRRKRRAMGILDNAKSMAEKVKENAPAILGKVEDQVEKLEGKGGTVGKLATSGHKVIDTLQEK